MADFPTIVPSITNPTANDTLAAVPHHEQHEHANDNIAAIGAKLGVVASTPVVGDTLVGTATGSSKWVQGVRTLRHYGAVGDGTTDDTTAVSAADAVAGEVYVPNGTFDTTLAATQLIGPFRGPGRIRDSADRLRGPWFMNNKTAPASLSSRTGGIDQAFGGDWSGCQIAMEHRIVGASTLGVEGSGYTYQPESFPIYINLHNTSGYQGLPDNGRSGLCAIRVELGQGGQGDAAAYNANVYVNSARSEATSYLQNPAGIVINGDLLLGPSGVSGYLNGGEFHLHDGGYDGAGIGWVINLDRNSGPDASNNRGSTGALSAWWQGVKVRSEGTAYVDVAYGASGPHVIGLDLSFLTLQQSGDYALAATTISGGMRHYLNADDTDASGYSRYPASAGTVYIDYSSSRINLAGADVNLSSGQVLKVNGTQVVGPRDTGWTAMTGTPNESTSYDVSSVTLPQLAARVAAIQAAITTHGLIGS